MQEIIYNWEALGARLAVLSDEEQAKFFAGFAKELDHFDTHRAKEMQMISINKKLNDPAKEILKEYLPAIWYKEGDE